MYKRKSPGKKRKAGSTKKKNGKSPIHRLFRSTKTITVVRGPCIPMRVRPLTGELNRLGINVLNRPRCKEHYTQRTIEWDGKSFRPVEHYSIDIKVSKDQAVWAEYVLMRFLNKYPVCGKVAPPYQDGRNMAWAQGHDGLPRAWKDRPSQYLPPDKKCGDAPQEGGKK
jgi:hypothetical protein